MANERLTGQPWIKFGHDKCGTKFWYGAVGGARVIDCYVEGVEIGSSCQGGYGCRGQFQSRLGLGPWRGFEDRG